MLTLILAIITALPAMIIGVEKLRGFKPKQGPYKWLSIEQAISGTVQDVATAAEAIPNADVDLISKETVVLAKAVNDAFVAFFNKVGWPANAPNPSPPNGVKK